MNRREIEKLAAELRGRRWDASDGKRVVEAWEKSGESVSVFAQRLGVSGQRLYWWQRRLGHSAGSSSPTQAEPERAWAAPILLPVLTSVRIRGNSVKFTGEEHQGGEIHR